MNYREYKLFQEEYLKENEGVFRADCMNPFKSMAYVLDGLIVEENDKNNSTSVDIREYVKKNIISNVSDEFIYYTKGIRDTLKQIEKQISGGVIIPKDIYPRYKDIFDSKVVREYETVEGINYEELLSNKSKVILLTIPSATDKDGMTSSKIDFVKELSKTNVVILDMVYDNDFKNTVKDLKELIENPNVILLYSLSKTYLLPEELGLVITSGRRFEYKYDRGEDTDRVISVLKQYGDLGKIQEMEYEKGWLNLKIQTGLEVESGKGYFRVINKSHEELLGMGIFSVPISVFGSDRRDYCIVTCLYYLDKI